jgi:polyhydroxyalkanoate synthesis regulator phasin
MAKLPTWDDVKRAADDLEKKVQGAGANAREKWQTQVKPKLAEVSKKIEAQGQKAGDAIQVQISALSDALLKLQQEISKDLKIGRKSQDPEKPPGE